MSRATAPKPQPRDGELPEEFQLRRLVAKTRLRAARAAVKRSGLGTHAAADTGRRNRDWRANNGSADLAIIPDSLTLIGRARQLVRDSWVAKSIVRAFRRNVVGKAITINPHAKGRDGKPLTALNKLVQAEFLRWSRSKWCDVERRKTFGQMQRLAAAEKMTVGEHVWMWSYAVPQGPGGRIDRSRPVGIQFQAIEPEQFDLRILSFEGREVRGGVEVDENGAMVAIHVYTRNPNDVLYRHAFFSERVPASRVFHYFEGERVLQTRGVTPMTPIMQDVRDLERFKGATLTRALMEACIGVIIKQQNLTTGLQGIQSTIPPAANDPGQTPSGMTEADFVPGMVANLMPNEDVSAFIPQTPGNTYDPFTQLTVRGIGAGAGMSFGQVMRHSDGNYSAARQDMLEDRKEWEPEQELIIDDLVRPAYERWFDFAAHEGRFDGVEGFTMEEFLADRHRFVEADFIPPPQTWIDPEKEANAFVVLLKNRLITREEIVAMRGGRFYQIIEKLAVESKETDALGLSLPENAEDRAALRDLVKAMLAAGTGTMDNVAANTADLDGLYNAAGIPTRKGYTPPLLPVIAAPGNPVTGDPVENAEGDVIAGGVEKVEPPAGPNGSPAPAAAAPANGKPAKVNGLPKNGMARSAGRPGVPANEIDSSVPASFGTSDVPPPGVPDYRASADPVVSCATCSYAVGERCSKYNFTFDPANVCDSWRAVTLVENLGAPNTAKTFPPFAQDGERTIENRFWPQADPTRRP